MAKKGTIVSSKVAEMAPVARYDHTNLHTTAFTLYAGPKINVMRDTFTIKGADGQEKQLDTRKTIETLAEIAYETVCAIWPRPFDINYSEILYTNTGVFAAGRPGQDFLQMATFMLELAGKRGIVVSGDKPQMKLPRMGHATLDRFLTDTPLTAEFKGFIDGVNAQGGLGISKTSSIDVGRYICTDNKFTLVVNESFTYKR